MPFNPGVDLGPITDVTADVAFGAARTPSDRVTVKATVSVYATGGSEARVSASVDGTEVGRASIDTAAGGLTANPDVVSEKTITFEVDRGESYTLTNDLDPNTANAIVRVTERPF